MPTQQIFASNFHFHSTVRCLFVWYACRMSARKCAEFRRNLSVCLMLNFYNCIFGATLIGFIGLLFSFPFKLLFVLFDWKAKTKWDWRHKYAGIISFYCPCVYSVHAFKSVQFYYFIAFKAHQIPINIRFLVKMSISNHFSVLMVNF